MPRTSSSMSDDSSVSEDALSFAFSSFSGFSGISGIAEGVLSGVSSLGGRGDWAF